MGGARVQGDAASIARIVARQKFAAWTCLGAWMDAPPQASRADKPPIQVSPVTSPIAHLPPVEVAAPQAQTAVHPTPKSSLAKKLMLSAAREHRVRPRPHRVGIEALSKRPYRRLISR
jgi:hypothetical protein